MLQCFAVVPYKYISKASYMKKIYAELCIYSIINYNLLLFPQACNISRSSASAKELAICSWIFWRRNVVVDIMALMARFWPHCRKYHVILNVSLSYVSNISDPLMQQSLFMFRESFRIRIHPSGQMRN